MIRFPARNSSFLKQLVIILKYSKRAINNYITVFVPLQLAIHLERFSSLAIPIRKDPLYCGGKYC